MSSVTCALKYISYIDCFELRPTRAFL